MAGPHRPRRRTRTPGHRGAGTAVQRVGGLLGDAVDVVDVVLDETVDHLGALVVAVDRGVVTLVSGAVDRLAPLIDAVPVLDAAPEYLETLTAAVTGGVMTGVDHVGPSVGAVPEYLETLTRCRHGRRMTGVDHGARRSARCRSTWRR